MISNQEETIMEENEKIEYTAVIPSEEPTFAPEPPKARMRRTFSRIALGLCIGFLVSQLVPSVLAFIPDFNIQEHAFLVGSLCTGFFTLPLMLLLTRRLPARQPDKNRLSIGAFLALVCISYACMIVGNLVGIGVNSLLSPNSVNLIGELATASGSAPLETILSFVILAPVFEELVFRKVLVDRVLPYGEWPAILFSGITFGAFHGNLTQLFYAALLGMVLAYVYIRTGRILYTIGIHACINFLGGVLPLLVPAASYFVMLVAVAGIALFFVLKKNIHVEKNAVPGVGCAMFSNAGMILFLLISAILMALVALVMNHPELTSGLM